MIIGRLDRESLSGVGTVVLQKLIERGTVLVYLVAFFHLNCEEDRTSSIREGESRRRARFRLSHGGNVADANACKVVTIRFYKGLSDRLHTVEVPGDLNRQRVVRGCQFAGRCSRVGEGECSSYVVDR